MTLQDYLRERKFSKRKVGDVTGLSQPTIKTYVEEPTRFSVGHIDSISKAMNVGRRELINVILND